MKYDSTAIEGSEKTVKKPPVEEELKAPRGRPRKGEERQAKEPSALKKQQTQSLEQMLKDMPKDCDRGGKKHRKGYNLARIRATYRDGGRRYSGCGTAQFSLSA